MSAVALFGHIEQQLNALRARTLQELENKARSPCSEHALGQPPCQPMFPFMLIYSCVIGILSAGGGEGETAADSQHQLYTAEERFRIQRAIAGWSGQ